MAEIIKSLTSDHLDAMKEVKEGATIYGYRLAMLLREVQRYDRSLIHIIDNMRELEQIVGEKFDGTKRLPYFGAILSEKGKTVLKNTVATE